jgi:hypothetical protein
MAFDAKIFLLLAAGLYVLMGAVHCLVALWDEQRNRFFMRPNDALREDLRSTGVWFATGATLLSTLEGLNLSHGLGVMIFGLATFGFSVTEIGSLYPVAVLLGALFFGVLYLLVALRYWTGLPAAGYGVAVTLIGIACLQHWL